MKTIAEFPFAKLNIAHVLLDLSKDEELSKYLNLFEKCFGKRENINADTFLWFGLKQPASENYTFGFIDNATGNLISAYGLLPLDAILLHKKVKCALCTSVMTDPAYSGMGLFVKIGEESIRYITSLGVSICLGIPNENAIKGHLNVGWTKMEDIWFYEKSKANFVSKSLSANFKILETKTYNERDFFYDDFVSAKYDFYISKNSSWLNWRSAKPNSDYLKYKITRNKDFCGYFVLKVFYDSKEAVRKLHIVDFGINGDESFLAMLNFTTELGLKNNSDLINIWASENELDYIEILTTNGFIKSLSKNYVIMFPIDKSISSDNIKNIRLSLFDNDVF